MQSKIPLSAQAPIVQSYTAEDFFAQHNVQPDYAAILNIFDLWNTLRGDQFAANYADFNISDLDNDIIPKCAVVNVTPGGADFIYRFWGTHLATISNVEITGKSVRELKPQSLADATIAAYTSVLQARTATVTTIHLQEVYSVIGKTISLRLPMSSNQKSIDVIFSAIVIDERDKKLIEEAAKNLIK